jgi:hypothetical protein
MSRSSTPAVAGVAAASGNCARVALRVVVGTLRKLGVLHLRLDRP